MEHEIFVLDATADHKKKIVSSFNMRNNNYCILEEEAEKVPNYTLQ